MIIQKIDENPRLDLHSLIIHKMTQAVKWKDIIEKYIDVIYEQTLILSELILYWDSLITVRAQS